MIKGLKIRDNSTYFSEETNIDLFWDEATPVNGRKYYSIVYGKNGSGKTTISDIFYNYKNKSKEYELLNFYDDSDTLVELPKESIFVFNEQFIDDFVKVSEDNDSLHAIVLLGKTV
ncbi:MAG: AAA family ATPase, partial [Candidatus Onthovivens sp.]|nr:AAA family ATPase [Candidatus Onthovivens sp.]